MTQPAESPHFEAPGAAQLMRASLIALAGAVVVFVGAVLPAEYGRDPLGTGHLLGIAKMSAPAAPQPAAPAVTVNELVQDGAATFYPGAFKQDTVEFVLEPFDYVEYKYDLVKGAAMNFSWKASAVVDHDFHGEPQADPEGGLQSYDKSAKQEANGSLVAPFTGIHGWYWHNTGTDTVTVKLISSGFYAGGLEFKSDGTKHLHALEAVAPAATGAK